MFICLFVFYFFIFYFFHFFHFSYFFHFFHFFLFFIFFFLFLFLLFICLFLIPFMIFALLFSLRPRRNSDPGSHSRLFPPTHYGSCLAFLSQENFSPFFPFSTRVELHVPTLSALNSGSFFCAQINSKSHHGGIGTPGPTLAAFEAYHESTTEAIRLIITWFVLSVEQCSALLWIFCVL